MNYKTVTLDIGVIMVAYVMLMLPVVSAASVNIMFNGDTQASVDVSPRNLVNKQVTIVHPPYDITWSKVKALVSISSASLAKSVSKIYLYKCKTANPVDCVKGEPLEFQSYIDTELAWDDISQKTGPGFYPQEANLLILVKLESDRETWAGFWDKITRSKHNVFDTHSYELGSLDFHVSSLDLVEPVRLFIENYQMVPFNWASKVVFTGASSLYGIGADSDEIDVTPPSWQTAQPATNQIDAIAKDYFFILGDTTSGIINPITLTRNPSFTCGDGDCESGLGESSTNCCYDCSCPDGQYCNLAEPEGTDGSCRSEDAVSLSILPVTPPEITDCTQPFDIVVAARVNNPPTGLPESIPAVLTIADIPYSITCTGSPVRYNCPVTLSPEVRCGVGTYDVGPNSLAMTVSYQDGINPITRDLTGTFGSVPVNHNCMCPDNQYCDSGTKTCLDESIIGLNVKSVTSFLEDYQPGQDIEIVIEVRNPPNDLTIPTKEYTIGNLTSKGTSTKMGGGTLDCTGGPDTNHVYSCTIPFNIDGYTHTSQYIISGNSVRFVLNFPSGGTTVERELTSGFTDITIPSYRCGDQTCNPGEEDQTNCCHDCGCPDPDNQYCDPERADGCQMMNKVKLVVDGVDPIDFDDCRVQHQAKVRVSIGNDPSGLVMERLDYLLNNQIKDWMQCTAPANGQIVCTLTIPPQNGECQDLSLGEFFRIGENNLTMSVAFTDGHGTRSKTIQSGFDDIFITPITDCGDGVCETWLGEDGSNCCIDCSCQEPEYFTTPDKSDNSDWYCDYDRQTNPDGVCKQATTIKLAIENVAPVDFKSCELTQKVNIKSHIENAPSGVRVEGWAATLEGKDVQFFHCKQENRFGNLSYNCTLRIPSVHNCTAGDAKKGVPPYDHTYQPNTISAYVSYPDGQLVRRKTQLLTEDINPIHVAQGKQTIYDITMEWRDFVMDAVDEIYDEMDKALDDLEKCIDAMIYTTYAMIGTMFVVPAFTSGSYWKGVEAMSKTGSFVLTAIGKICDMMKQKHDMVTKRLQAQIEMKGMKFCLQMVHHKMDTGMCAGQEKACFSEILGCLSQGFSNLDKLSSQMGQINNNLVKDANDIANAGVEMAKAWEAATAEPEGNLVVRCGGSTKYCCEHAGVRSGATIVQQLVGGLKIVEKKEDCKSNKITIRTSGIKNCGKTVTVRLDDQAIDWSTSPDVKTFNWAYGSKHTFQAYCGGDELKDARATIEYIEDKDLDCYCKGNEVPAGSSSGTGGTGTTSGPDAASLAGDAKQNVEAAITKIDSAKSLVGDLKSGWASLGETILGIFSFGAYDDSSDNLQDAKEYLALTQTLEVKDSGFKSNIDSALTELGSVKSAWSGVTSSNSGYNSKVRELKSHVNNAISLAEAAKTKAGQSVTAQSVDLAVQDLSLDKETVLPGETVKVTFKVRNTGSAEIPAGSYEATITLDGSAVFGPRKNNNIIKPGSRASFTDKPVVIPSGMSAGKHTIKAAVKMIGSAGEKSTANNHLSKEITVNIKPRVTSYTPSSKTNLPVSKVTINFNIPVEGCSFQLTDKPTATPTPSIGTKIWSSDKKRVDITINDIIGEPTPSGAKYTIEVTGCHNKDYSGAVIDATDATFYVTKTASAPKVRTGLSTPTGQSVAVDVPITVYFDMDMDKSKTSGILVIQKTDEGGGELACTGSWPTDRKYVCTHSAPFTKDKNHKVIVLKDGAKSTTPQGGLALADDVFWTFKVTTS